MRSSGGARATRRLRRGVKKGSGLDPSGFDAGKKIKGRKRHILVDTLGLLLNVVVHPVVWRTGAWKLQIVKRSDATGFAVLPKKMDCRKDVRLDQSQSSFGSRLGTLRLNRCRIRSPRHDPHHAPTACGKRLVMNPNFPDGLLGPAIIGSRLWLPSLGGTL
jgi:hypothetical protein